MITSVTISDGRQVAVDIDPMDDHQQNLLVTAIVDFLVRSGQIRDDICLTGPHLLQFLSEAADMAADQAGPAPDKDDGPTAA